MKKKRAKTLKKKLDKLFSEYIRRFYADENEEVQCYTCPAKKHWKEMQAGHFVSRGYLATRFSEENVRPQCVGCNIFGGGRTALFASKLDSERRGTVSRLYREAQQIVKNYPFEVKIDEYEEKLKVYEIHS